MLISDGPLRTVVTWIWLVAGIGWGVRTNVKYGVVPKREHLRDPKGVPYAAFWNLFSHDKWTDEGVALHKRLAVELLIFVVVWLVGFRLLR